MSVIIHSLRSKGLSVREIAKRVGKSKSSVHATLQKSQLSTVGAERFVEKALELASPLPVRGAVGDGNEEWIHLISDLHVGYCIDGESTNGLAHYNNEVLKEEIRGYKERLLGMGRFPKQGHIFILGDIVEGVTIYRGQQRQLDLSLVEQVITASEELADLIAFINTLYPVSVYCVVGNHGRVGFVGEQKPLDSMDLLVYKYLEGRLSDVRVAKSWFDVVNVQGKRFLLTHGEDCPPSAFGIPFYGVHRLYDKWSKLVDFDYMALGHFHTPSAFNSIFMNGSWVGGSEFSLKRLVAASPPSQKIIAMADGEVAWVKDVLL